MVVSATSMHAGLSSGQTVIMPRLAVAWQHPETRSIRPVGLLSHADDIYQFHYIRNVLNVSGFVPFLGFPNLDHRYTSTRLFPLFAQRVMDPRRPDYAQYVRTLDLALDATPWEQLTRSEGRRAGDAIMVFPEPHVDANETTWAKFLAHGVRHVLQQDPSVDARLSALRQGDELMLVPDVSNPFNGAAIHVADGRLAQLGWVPDLLLDYVHIVHGSGPSEIRVEHVNGPEAPAHLRLLVRLAGTVPLGYMPFVGRSWEPLT